MTAPSFRFSIDRGGTFTDVYAEVPGEPGFRVVKLLSEDPQNYPDAPREGIRRILESVTGKHIPKASGGGSTTFSSENIEWIRMGTTVATNALLERKGARTVLVTTKGFRDLLQIGNQSRPKIFDLEIQKLDLLYEEVIEVDERVRIFRETVKGSSRNAPSSIVEATTGEKFADYCGDTVYVSITSKYESDKDLESKRHEILKELEDPTSDTAKFGKTLTRKILSDQLDTVWNFGASYDCLNFESEILYSKLWEKIFERMKSENLVQLEDQGDNAGCWVLPIENEDDKIIVRSNGAATYVAKDIPYAAWKLGALTDPFNYAEYTTQPNGRTLYETTLEETQVPKQSFDANKVITVIDNRQANLQKIVTNIMSKFNPERSYVHLGYEAVTLSAETAKILGNKTDGKDVQMSGRKGLYINADEIIAKLEKHIFLESKERNDDLDDALLNEIAHNVAIGTIRYELIKPDLGKIITFDINTSLKLEGDTCSYIQYSCVRAARILEKFGEEPNFDTQFDQLNTEYETNLIKQIGLFEVFVNDAAKNYSPKVIAKYCYDLAVAFSSFYEHVNVLKADTPELINARLCLVLSFKLTLENALNLIGIIAPQRM